MATYKESRVEVSCQECGHQFLKEVSRRTFEIKCPRCKSYDVEVY